MLLCVSLFRIKIKFVFTYFFYRYIQHGCQTESILSLTLSDSSHYLISSKGEKQAFSKADSYTPNLLKDSEEIYITHCTTNTLQLKGNVSIDTQICNKKENGNRKFDTTQVTHSASSTHVGGLGSCVGTPYLVLPRYANTIANRGCFQ